MDERDIDYEYRASHYPQRSNSVAAALVIVFVGGIFITGLIYGGGGSNNPSPAVVDAPVTAQAAQIDKQTQEQLRQVQTSEQAARQEIADLQAQLQANQTALQQSQENLQRAEARITELQIQVGESQQQLERITMALPVLLALMVVLFAAIASMRAVVARQNNKQLNAERYAVQERERKIQWEASRMRAMYQEALDKAHGQLELMRSQLAQARSSVARRSSERTTVSRGVNR